MEHRFFLSINWQDVVQKKVSPHCLPQLDPQGPGPLVLTLVDASWPQGP